MTYEPLKMEFNDFKKLAVENNKRIYYYQMDNIVELAYLTEGIIIKSFVDLNQIPNTEAFFSQKLFVGATKLLFRIPERGDIVSMNEMIMPIDVVEEEMPTETKMENTDLQREAVK